MDAALVAAVEVALEVAILVAVALPFVRLAACPPFLRRMGGAPELAVVFVGTLVGYFIAVAVVALFSPTLLRPLAAAALGLAAFARWRSRPNRGNSKLPPGVLRIAPLGPWTNQDYYADDARRFGPIFKTSTFLGPVACVVGLPAALDLFKQHDRSLVPPQNRFGRFIPRGFIRSMADADHDRYAPLLRSALSAPITRAAEPELRAIIRDQIDKRSADTPIRELTWAIVFRTYLRLFFGIGPTHPDVPRLERLYERMDPLRAWRSTPGSIQRAVDEAAAIVERCATSGRDTFLDAARRAHPEHATDPTLIKNLVFLAHTAGADVAGLLAWILKMLSDNPRWADRVRAESAQPEANSAQPEAHSAQPEADSAQSGAPAGVPLAKRIVQETLRLEQSEFIQRRVTRDIYWRGFLIPKGWRVRICVRESHRDPAVFSDPDTFDPDRWLRATPARTDYSPFGAATTRATCLGEGLTLTIGRLFVEELNRGFDWQLAGHGAVEFSGIHWRPNSRLRFSARARSHAAAMNSETASVEATTVPRAA